MGTRDPRVDAYIEKSAAFAKPILRHLRAVVHGACPPVVETIKWGMPAFEHRGPMCAMAAFKAHCAFNFWKHALVLEERRERPRDAMGSFGRITTLADLPPKAQLARLVKKAAKLNDDGVKVERKRGAPRQPLKVHPALAAALARNRRAAAAFEAFTPGKRRDYVEWIAEAKGEDTRARRLEQAIAWIAEGKPRNWKYAQC